MKRFDFPAYRPHAAVITRIRAFRGLAAPCNAGCNEPAEALAPLIRASNEAPPVQARAIGAVNEQLAGEADWIRISPFGEFPNKVGRQLVDREAGTAMVAAFNSISTRLANLFRGLPVYEGHPDDPAWIKANPGQRAVAVGRVKELQVRDDGLWGRVAWNDRGTALVRGEAPAYTAQSPHWGMLPCEVAPGGRKLLRPVEVFSLGLTNHPNIPDTLLGVNEAGVGETASPIMREKLIALLAALGRPVTNPSAVSDEQLVAAANEALAPAAQLVTSAARVPTLETELATSKAQLTTAANETATLRTQIGAERTARVDLVLTAAVNEGRITQGQRAEWQGKLTATGADFPAVVGQLQALKPAINTRSGLGAIGSRKTEVNLGTITAINEAIEAKKKAVPHLSHTDACIAVQREKPELFKATA